jgi:copper chaperone
MREAEAEVANVPETSESETRIALVPGMTCGHCVAAVTSEVSAVAGVTSVAIDLESKRVTIQGANLNNEALRLAIDEAGFVTTSIN